MNYDIECGYRDAGWDGMEPCCPECGSMDIDLESGDHGYVCYDCETRFMVP